jgi:tRNA(fMet)-specific endonuclease VapC
VASILIDTNAYVAFKKGLPEALEIIQRAPTIALPVTVLGELLAGFAVGSQTERNRRELQAFLTSPRAQVLTVDELTAEVYARVYRELRSKGRPIPTNDLWIAALALQHSAALFTFDQHFALVDGLIVGTNTAALGL